MFVERMDGIWLGTSEGAAEDGDKVGLMLVGETTGMAEGG